MIEHDHVEAKLARDLERLAADRAAVDGHHERRALRGETLNRLDIGAIALGHAVGDMDDRLKSAGVEIFAEERGAARAVDVIVAEDRHSLAGHDRALEALGRGLHVAEAKGVRHQIAEARREMAVNRLRRDAAPGEHAGDQFVVPADLRNGERAQFPRRVKARPPRPAERRGLNVEEIIGGRQDRRLRIPSTRRPANQLPPREIMPEGGPIQKEFERVRATEESQSSPSFWASARARAMSPLGRAVGDGLWTPIRRRATPPRRGSGPAAQSRGDQQCLISCRASRCGFSSR